MFVLYIDVLPANWLSGAVEAVNGGAVEAVDGGLRIPDHI